MTVTEKLESLIVMELIEMIAVERKDLLIVMAL